MEKTVKSGELVKNKTSRKMLVGQITILTVIFTVGKVTTILSLQKIIMLSGLWTIFLLGSIVLKHKVLSAAITNRNYLTCKLNKENSSNLLRFLDITFYLIIKYTDVLILKVFFKVEAINTHLIPKEGAVIVTANHTSHVDGMALTATFPKRITYMMLSKNYETWGKWFFKTQHAIPVKEQGVNGDALKESLELLRNNGTLCIFPEGKITPDGNLQDGNPGIAFLAIKSKATIVPAYVDGAFEVLSAERFLPRFRKIKIIYGEPIYYNDKYINEKKSREQLTNKIMGEIRKLSCIKDA
jgi:1-acyl-sn-glycerol-3-phosphate acyltransferase